MKKKGYAFFHIENVEQLIGAVITFGPYARLANIPPPMDIVFMLPDDRNIGAKYDPANIEGKTDEVIYWGTSEMAGVPDHAPANPENVRRLVEALLATKQPFSINYLPFLAAPGNRVINWAWVEDPDQW
ncbi:MAG: hypothetical protein V1838_03205 [Patescibacteria group bacterium]